MLYILVFNLYTALNYQVYQIKQAKSWKYCTWNKPSHLNFAHDITKTIQNFPMKFAKSSRFGLWNVESNHNATHAICKSHVNFAHEKCKII